MVCRQVLKVIFIVSITSLIGCQSDKDRLKERLNNFIEAISFEKPPSALMRNAKYRKIAEFFKDDFEIDFKWETYPGTKLKGKDELEKLVSVFPEKFGKVAVIIRDLKLIELNSYTIKTKFTAIISHRTPYQKVDTDESGELFITWEKTGKEWNIIKAGNVPLSE